MVLIEKLGKNQNYTNILIIGIKNILHCGYQWSLNFFSQLFSLITKIKNLNPFRNLQQFESSKPMPHSTLIQLNIKSDKKIIFLDTVLEVDKKKYILQIQETILDESEKIIEEEVHDLMQQKLIECSSAAQVNQATEFSIETTKKKHKGVPKPNNLTDDANESSEKFKVNNRQSTLEIPKLENANKKEMSKSVTISPVSEVSKGVYTAEGRTEKGENIYFGMELIDDTSREIWGDYSKAADSLCSVFLRRMVRFLDDENTLKDLQQHSGLSEEEFKNLASQFRKRGLHPQGKLAEAISDISGGIAGFMILPNLSGVFAPATYVAYISKKPITGPLYLPKTESNLKIFKEKYKDILMSVGVRLDSSRPLFENRGIFRNPFSVIEGGYSNISTQLHSFTGKVMKECVNQTLGNKEKLYMSVSPINNMKELLVKKIGLERIKTKNDIPKELRIESNGLLEEQFLIELEDLANLH